MRSCKRRLPWSVRGSTHLKSMWGPPHPPFWTKSDTNWGGSQIHKKIWIKLILILIPKDQKIYESNLSWLNFLTYRVFRLNYSLFCFSAIKEFVSFLSPFNNFAIIKKAIITMIKIIIYKINPVSDCLEPKSNRWHKS